MHTLPPPPPPPPPYGPLVTGVVFRSQHIVLVNEIVTCQMITFDRDLGAGGFVPRTNILKLPSAPLPTAVLIESVPRNHLPKCQERPFISGEGKTFLYFVGVKTANSCKTKGNKHDKVTKWNQMQYCSNDLYKTMNKYLCLW